MMSSLVATTSQSRSTSAPFTSYLLSWHLAILQRDSGPTPLVRQTPALVDSLMKRLLLSSLALGAPPEKATAPEYVKIIRMGGARKFIPTGSFFEMNPVNLLKNFRINSVFGIDSEVLADFSGEVAPKYSQLHRAIQRICVNVCNKQSWIIPFTQITVHQAPPAES